MLRLRLFSTSSQAKGAIKRRIAPQLITSLISRAETAAEAANIARQHLHRLNLVHAAVALSRISTLPHSISPSAPVPHISLHPISASSKVPLSEYTNIIVDITKHAEALLNSSQVQYQPREIAELTRVLSDLDQLVGSDTNNPIRHSISSLTNHVHIALQKLVSIHPGVSFPFRDLSMILSSLAKISSTPKVSCDAFPVLTTVAHAHFQFSQAELIPRDIALVGWALGKIKSSQGNRVESPATNTNSLFDDLAKVVLRSSFAGYSLSQRCSLVVGIANASAVTPSTVTLLAEMLVYTASHVKDFSCRELCNIVWAYGKIVGTASYPSDTSSLRTILQLLTQQIHQVNPQGIAHAVWAIAKLNHRDVNFHRAARNQVLKSIRSSSLRIFEPQQLSMFLWGYVHSNMYSPDSELFSRIVAEMEHPEVLAQFGPQALANTAWAFAKADLPLNLQALFANISNHAVSKLQYFKPQEIVGLLHAFSRLRLWNSNLFEQCAQILVARHLSSMTIREMAMVAWAFASTPSHQLLQAHPTLRASTQLLFLKMAPKILASQMKIADSGHLCSLAWAYAVVGAYDLGVIRHALSLPWNEYTELSVRDATMLYWCHLGTVLEHDKSEWGLSISSLDAVRKLIEDPNEHPMLTVAQCDLADTLGRMGFGGTYEVECQVRK
jgi:hypothetical protein